jgi:hypothetical protein
LWFGNRKEGPELTLAVLSAAVRESLSRESGRRRMRVERRRPGKIQLRATRLSQAHGGATGPSLGQQRRRCSGLNLVERLRSISSRVRIKDLRSDNSADELANTGLFMMANPCVPGIKLSFYRDFLHDAGGTSREMEIAAEVSRPCDRRSRD